jgi:glycosyltransferase involved in cell wall biosynthesis
VKEYSGAGPLAGAGDRPLVSVAIPSYNAASTLAETIDSVLAQSYPNIEVIVVDDGSKDHTPAVLEKYAGRVVGIRTANGGLAAARNTGLARARGHYLALLDADDVCEPERIRMQVDFMEGHPAVVLCSTDFSAFDTSGEISRSHIARYYSMVREAPDGVRSLYRQHGIVDGAVKTCHGDVYQHLVAGNFVHPPTVLFRRTVLDRAGRFNRGLPNTSDWDWLIRVSRTGPLGFIDRPLLRYRLSPSQMSSSRNRAVKTQEIADVMSRLEQVDPALFQRCRGELRRRLAACYLDAADAHAETHLARTLANLWTSLRYAPPRAATLKVLAKALLPPALLRLYRLAS